MQAIGAKGGGYMKTHQVEYKTGRLGKLVRIEDNLPKPSELVFREDNVKVTLSLSRQSLEFFKREAKRQRVPYQRMIRALVDKYATRAGR